MSSPISVQLNQKQSPSLKQTQRLIMSPQMQQAIQMLQMPVLELSTIISSELEKNPILEIDEDHVYQESEISKIDHGEHENEMDFNKDHFDILNKLDHDLRDHFQESGNYNLQKNSEEEKRRTFVLSSIQETPSLFRFIMQQVNEVFETKQERLLAQIIIGNFDSRGFFTTSLQELAITCECSESTLKAILKKIQTLEPYGIGGTNLQESLLIQLRCLKQENSLSYIIIKDHYDHLIHNRLPLIQKALKVPLKPLQQQIEKTIARLDFHPGSSLSSSSTHYITPDIILNYSAEGVEIDVSQEPLPTLKINAKYLRMLEDESLPQETREYIQEKISSGKWLLHNLFQRNQTLHNIAEVLIEQQKDFLTTVEGKLKPLTMKVIAQELQLHESTIARAISNKYMSTMKGILPLRSFFTNAYTTKQGEEISSKTVKETLLELVNKEDKNKPYSDKDFSEILQNSGIPCARRTVAKYRHELNLGNASQRKIHL